MDNRVIHKKKLYCMVKPQLSGYGGTFGYDILKTATLKYLLSLRPYGHSQQDCYGIEHRLAIRLKNGKKLLYKFNEEKDTWISIR